MKKEMRSIEQIVDEQLSKWSFRSKEGKSEAFAPKPVITLSREPGCATPEIAKQLSERLQMQIIAGQITEQIAKSALMDEKAVKAIIEKEVTKRDGWLTSLFETRYLFPADFLIHLKKVIDTVGRHGDVIIIGLGAPYVLPPAKTFRVRLIAPLNSRVNRIMAIKSCSRDEAERYAVTTESDRRAFIQKYFNADVTNPADYDILINVSSFTMAGAVETIISAFETWKKGKNL